MKLLKRGARAAAKGTYYSDEIICGYPVSVWVELTEETYDLGMMGIRFNGWPNGQSLIEQEQCVIDILKVVLIELAKEFTDGKKKRN